MTPEEAYLKFLQKVNKNYTNDNISVDKGRFVQVYNESQNKFIEWILDKKNEDDIREIQILVVLDKKLSEEGKFVELQSFKFPSNYFSFSNVKAFATKGKCANKRIYLHEIKNENDEEVLRDKFNKPSFEFRDAPFTIGDDSVNIFNGDFKIIKVLLKYYRQPIQLDIAGYTNINNKPSVSVSPEFRDEIIDRIISIAAKEFNINVDNLDRVMIDKDRITTNY